MKTKHKQGMTIVEIMMVVAASTIVALATVSVMGYVNKNARVVERAYESMSGEYLGNLKLFNDIHYSTPSYNNILGLTDDVKAGLEFFTLQPDVNCVPTSVEPCSRSVSLASPQNAPAHLPAKGPAGQVSRRFVMLVADDLSGAPQSFNPVRVYGTNGGSLDKEATLSFKADVFRSLLQGPPYTESTCSDPRICSRMWTVGELLQFFSPVYLRPFDAANDTTLWSAPARQPSFVGRVTKNKFNAAFDPDNPLIPDAGGVQLSYRHPAAMNSDPARNYADIDSFFMRLTPVGGSGPLAFVRRVTLIAYQVETVYFHNRWTRQLVRLTHDGSKFATREVLAVPIDRVTFFRENISVPTIKVTIHKEEEL